MKDSSTLLQEITRGDFRALARAISMVENEATGSEELLQSLPVSPVPVMGITGPPGAGKSTLVNRLVAEYIQRGSRTGIITVDPSSPFNFGSLLGDRLRMKDHFNDPAVYIRSLATRGSLGGLSEKIMEITDVMRAAPFDVIFVETVGVGQSEVEIAGLADLTIVVLVPESGDDVQAMKAGLMEIADIFVVNKADRADAERFMQHLLQAMGYAPDAVKGRVPVVKTVATTGSGTGELMAAIGEVSRQHKTNDKKSHLLLEKVWRLMIKKRMQGINREKLLETIRRESAGPGFNLYRFAETYR